MTASRILFLLLVVSLFSACALTPGRDASRFYTLPSESVAQMDLSSSEIERESQQIVVVGVMPVRIPAYLDRPTIVLTESNGRVSWQEDIRWAEPLDAGITRVLREAISKERPSLDVRAFPQTDRADYRVYAEVTKLEVRAEGEVVFEAALRIEHASTHAVRDRSRVMLRREWRAGDYADLAGIVSEGLNQLVSRCAWSDL